MRTGSRLGSSDRERMDPYRGPSLAGYRSNMSNPSLPAKPAASRNMVLDHEKLTNLGHLAGGVGHHVINAFSAIVSNAELLRLKSTSKAGADPAALAETIIQTSLDAAT